MCLFTITLCCRIGLKNDHKDLMRKIEEGLHRVHALAGASKSEQSISDVSDVQETEALEPFLRVNLVSPGSPAETAVCIIPMLLHGQFIMNLIELL